jgi:hypothetical protein
MSNRFADQHNETGRLGNEKAFFNEISALARRPYF